MFCVKKGIWCPNEQAADSVNIEIIRNRENSKEIKEAISNHPKLWKRQLPRKHAMGGMS